MGEAADCPDCGSANVRKQFSVFAAHGVESGAARRSAAAAAAAAAPAAAGTDASGRGR